MTSERVRLAELLAALSLGIDLGFGQPMEHVLRQCLISLRLAEAMKLDDQTRLAVYYTALLVTVGCHTDAHEQAKWFGDDIALKSDKYDYEVRSLRGAAAGMSRLGAGSPILQRFRIGLEFAMYGHRDLEKMIEHHAALARLLGEQLRLPQPVLDALGCAYEQWDGRGWPGNYKESAIPLATRLATIGEFVEVAYRVGGIEAATKLARARAGKQFDPELCALLVDHAQTILSGLETVGTWDAVIAAEPALGITLTDDQFDEALTAVADFVDLKSPYTLGHGRALADLAGRAAERLGMSTDEQRTITRAGLTQGFGRLGVSNSIWEKRGPLGAGEWERVRLHPYLTERMLRQSPALAPLGAIVAQHRERLDGSGYPKGLARGAISRHAMILGTADAYQAMREPRPHREALSPERAATELRHEATAGRMDGYVVEAVLGAAGHRSSGRKERPAGLTQREIEILRLVARGMSNKGIAQRLFISPKTVGNHVEHIYTKINATNRASASLFAVQNGLLPHDEAEAGVFA
jgi:HD-GYP domain-containing protein (c-di-GMP phosphodiesterase class II)